MFCSY